MQNAEGSIFSPRYFEIFKYEIPMSNDFERKLDDLVTQIPSWKGDRRSLTLVLIGLGVISFFGTDNYNTAFLIMGLCVGGVLGVRYGLNKGLFVLGEVKYFRDQIKNKYNNLEKQESELRDQRKSFFKGKREFEKEKEKFTLRKNKFGISGAYLHTPNNELEWLKDIIFIPLASDGEAKNFYHFMDDLPVVSEKEESLYNEVREEILRTLNEGVFEGTISGKDFQLQWYLSSRDDQKVDST